MTFPSAHPGTAEREALIARLQALIASTRLTVTQFALQAGSYQSRWQKILSVEQNLLPGPEDLAAAVRLAGASPDVLAELTVLLEQADGEKKFNKLLGRKGGMAAHQTRIGEIEQRHTRIGDWAVGYIPALFQSRDYIRELTAATSGASTWLRPGMDPEAETEAMIDARRARRDILYDPGKQIQAVLAESSLRMLLVSPETLAGQLVELLALMRLPSVDVRVLGFGQRVPAYPLPFRMFDDTMAATESIAEDRYYRIGEWPVEVEKFRAAFEALHDAAVGGEAAEAIIRRSLDSLGVLPPDTRP